MTVTEQQVIQGRYFQDILAQPAALQSTLQQITRIPEELIRIRERLHGGELRRIVLTGMGSSLLSLEPAALTLRNGGYEVVLMETSELIHYGKVLLHHGSLVVAVSQSGRSAEIIRLLELNNRQATMLAVTNDATSPLGRAADAVLLTDAGDEFSVSSKTYLTTLAVVQTITGYLCYESFETVQNELLASLPLVASYLAGWQQHVVEVAPLLAGKEHLFFVGRGASLAAAGTGALITKESVAVHAEAMSCASLRHGPMEILQANTFVAVLEGEAATRALNEKLVTDIRATPAKAELIGYHGELPCLRIAPSPARVLPILEVLPFQMMTLALGALLHKEAGVFQVGSKVTVTE